MSTLSRMINILPYALRNGENINKIYTILSEMLDEIIEAAVEIQDSRDLDKAFGFGLDLIGHIVGEPRNNSDDETYRENLKTKIRRNRSNGNIEILNEFARTLLDNNFIGFTENGIKSGELSLQYDFPRENPTTKDPVILIKKIMAVGVQLKTQLNTYSNLNNSVGIANMQSNHITIRTEV